MRLLCAVLLLLGVAVASHALAASASQKSESATSWVPFPISLVLTEECADIFLFQRNLFHVPCLKQTAAKGAGWAIVVFSSLLKLPMVYNMVKAKSASGLSRMSLLIESSALIATFSMAFRKDRPFSTYGDTLIIFLQNVLILVLLEYYSRKSHAWVLKALFVVGLLAGLVACANLAVPADQLDYLVFFAIGCQFSSRLPQIYRNWSQGHTGVLSIITQGLIFVGILVRFATVLAVTDDAVEIGSYVIGIVLNTTVLLQVLYYRAATLKVLKEEKAKKTE